MERIVLDLRISDRGAMALSVVAAATGAKRPGENLREVIRRGYRPDPVWFARGRAGQRIQPLVDARTADDIAAVARHERVAVERWIEALLVTAALDLDPNFRNHPCFPDRSAAIRWSPSSSCSSRSWRPAS